MSPRGLRVTGGRLGGRRMRTPRRGTRPTSDRVREALFSRLGDLGGTAVLDLYAGTGALGVEALSRGAVRAVFVERDSGSIEVLRSNLESLGLSDEVRVVRADAAAAVRRLGRAGEHFDLVLVDPPYASDEVERVLEALLEAQILADDAVVVVEHGRRHPLPAVPGWVELDARGYGDTTITRLAARDADPERGAQQGGPSGE